MTAKRKPAGDVMAQAMSEDDLMGHIACLCKDLGLLAYHTRNSRRSTAGYPDWHIVGPAASIFRECKSEKGRTTAAQDEWISWLRRAGHDADVWRPRDLLSGRVQRELVALAGMATSGQRAS